jgi:hypothetical protein
MRGAHAVRRVGIWALLAIVAALALSLIVTRVMGAAQTQVTAAGNGVFPPGATLNGIPLQGSTFGFGVVVYPDGTADGDFTTVLAGTTLLGQPQTITLEAKVNAGSSNGDGSVTFSGSGTLDMGDGTLPTPNVPFNATVTTGGLQLTIGTSVLPTQTVGADDIYIG